MCDGVCVCVCVCVCVMQVPRTEWVLKWPGQVVIAGCQTFWTAEVSATLKDGHLPDLYQTLLAQVYMQPSIAWGLYSAPHRNRIKCPGFRGC